jgi:hypothetical protein
LDGSSWPTHHDWSCLAAARDIRNANRHAAQLLYNRRTHSPSALEFERRIHAHGEVETRPQCWHDAFHACAWLAFPRTKARINALHVADGAHASPNRRSALRNFLTCSTREALSWRARGRTCWNFCAAFAGAHCSWNAGRLCARQWISPSSAMRSTNARCPCTTAATGKGILLTVGTDYFSLDLEAKLAFLDAAPRRLDQ